MLGATRAASCKILELSVIEPWSGGVRIPNGPMGVQALYAWSSTSIA